MNSSRACSGKPYSVCGDPNDEAYSGGLAPAERFPATAWSAPYRFQEAYLSAAMRTVNPLNAQLVHRSAPRPKPVDLRLPSVVAR